jgi:hypothetical protein
MPDVMSKRAQHSLYMAEIFTIFLPCQEWAVSVAEDIFNRIKRMPKGKPFAGAIFGNVGSRAAVGKALSRMVRSGYLERVVLGIEAVRRLGLSTQMQVLPTYYTSGSMREIKTGNAAVRLCRVSAQRLQQAGTLVGMAMTAFLYLGTKGMTKQLVFKIASSLSAEEFRTLTACKMPRCMRLALAGYAKEHPCQ